MTRKLVLNTEDIKRIIKEHITMSENGLRQEDVRVGPTSDGDVFTTRISSNLTGSLIDELTLLTKVLTVSVCLGAVCLLAATVKYIMV